MSVLQLEHVASLTRQLVLGFLSLPPASLGGFWATELESSHLNTESPPQLIPRGVFLFPLLLSV